MKKIILIVTVSLCVFQLFSQGNSNVYVSYTDCYISKNPKLENSICDLHKFDTVRVLDSTKKYYKVHFNHYSGYYLGYVLKDYLFSWSEYMNRYVLPKSKSEIERYIKLIEIFGDSVGAMTYRGVPWVGMTEREAYYCLGEPHTRSVILDEWGSLKRFHYQNTVAGGKGFMTLYFKNGVLTHFTSEGNL